MTNFSHLKDLEVTADKTARYPFHQITVNGKSPTLIVSPATEANKPFFNRLLKKAGKSARQVRAGAISAGMIDENRDEDKELYPQFIVKGWEDMLDGETGDELKFSRKLCEEFLAALPGHMFDELRSFCSNPASFTDIIDIEVNAKN